MWKLHVVPADGEPYDHLFEEDSLVIGRSSSADLPLADPFLSRHHARMYREADGVLIEDLGSRNGTVVNGQLISRPSPVNLGDVIKVSGSVISIHGADEEIEPASTPDLSKATIFRPVSEMLLDTDTATAPEELVGEDALRRYAERLRLLNEIHEALGRSVELEDLLELILERAFEHLGPQQGAIFLKEKEEDQDEEAEGNGFYCAASRPKDAKEELPLSRALVHEVAEKGMAALVLDVATDERFAAAQSIVMSGVRSLVAAPLMDAAGSMGIIVLSSKAAVRQFSEEDMELLVSLASVAALKLRNQSLAEEAAQRRLLEDQLDIARRIQLALLPDQLPSVEGYAMLGRNIPSRGISGDYYEVVERQDGRECVLVVADVSGKGIAASLLTFSLQAYSVAPIEAGLATDEICAGISRHLHLRTPPERYATAFFAVLELESGHITYTNAGHNPGLIIRHAGDVETLPACGMPLGLMPGATYEVLEASLSPGDTLFLYTDGIIEAEDPDEKEYGLQRLTKVCLGHREASLEELADAIEKDLEKFARGVPFADDRTVVVARRLKE